MSRKEIAIISMIFFLTVIAWIGFSLYHAKTESGLQGIKKIDISPLTPFFDNDIISLLKEKED